MRKILVILLCCTVVLLAGYVGLRAYRSWKQAHMVSLARQFAANADLRSAVLSASQVLRANPRNVEANRFLADLAESSHSPEAVLWRSRVLELNPNSPEDRLALVQTALGQGDLLTATNALAGMPEPATNTADYHLLAGLIAAATRQIPQAEAHLLQATHLQPTNPVPQMNLAVLRLMGTNGPAQAEARSALQQCTTNPAVRSQAFRELIADALRHRQTNDALALSRKLVQPTNAALSDRLFQLQVLHALGSDELSPALALCQRAATNTPAHVYQLATWQLVAQGPQAALSWLESLPAQTQSNRTVQLSFCDCHLRQQNWRALQLSLPQQNWAELDFLRHAYLARALRGLDLNSSADTEWALALKAANSRKGNLLMLLRLAAGWKWRSEAEELLWTFVNRYPDEKWAFLTLHETLFTEGRTRSLMTLYGHKAKQDPTSLEMKNNLAMTALLLNAQELKPCDLAREVYEKASTNALYASTYAFSLHVLKKDAEALRVMEQLPLRQLEHPAIAGYYGLILQATGSQEKAKPYLNCAAKARLLPEERQLFAQAQRALAEAIP